MLESKCPCCCCCSCRNICQIFASSQNLFLCFWKWQGDWKVLHHYCSHLKTCLCVSLNYKKIVGVGSGYSPPKKTTYKLLQLARRHIHTEYWATCEVSFSVKSKNDIRKLEPNCQSYSSTEIVAKIFATPSKSLRASQNICLCFS